MRKHFFYTNAKILKKLCSVSLSLALVATTTAFGTSTSLKPQRVNAATTTIRDFSLNEVTMYDDYSVNAFKKELSYLLSFDTQKLLAGFRENAGLYTNAARYDGWESCLIGGHTLGHYLTAVSQAYNNPSISSSEKSKLYSQITTLVDGLLVCQQNSKGKPGFLWGAKQDRSKPVEYQFNNVEQGKTNIIDESWVPWYTMHKLMAGLNDVYNLTGYEKAKNISSSLGDWTYNRCHTWSQSTHNTVLSIEYGGMNDCLYELYKITHKETHAIAAHYFDETNLFERVLSGGANILNNRHANTTIPKFIGALKRYTCCNGKVVEGSTVNASQYLKYAEAFWDMVTTRHSYITGGNSEWEHFGLDYKLDAERTNCNCETCNSYNMLKLTRELFKLTGDPKYMDYYENTYYNSILSSQNPETGMTTYFQPMASGYFKVYGSRYSHFWCCTGSGMENFTKLGDTLYMHNGNTLYVNLYQSSKLNWKEKNVAITQTSTIPDGEETTFQVAAGSASKIDFRFRIPNWCAGNMVIKKNGVTVSYDKVNGYARLEDTFQNGDKLTLTIPEKVAAYSLPDNDSVYAFKYGPVVLSAQLGTADMTTGSTGMFVTIPAKKLINSETIQINKENGSVAAFMKNISKFLVKDANSLSFKLTGTNTSLTFSPHYLQYTQRYAIYLYYQSDGAGSDVEARAQEDITDTVQPGYGQYESDDLHAMVDQNTVGITSDGTYRYAKAGGSFTYRMAIDEKSPYHFLLVTLRRADNGKTLKIKVGNTILYAKTLDYDGSNDSYQIKIMIPDSALTGCVSSVTFDNRNYSVVNVTFSSNDSKDSARVCDFIYMTGVTPDYSFDSNIAYYVNCGDHNRTTASGYDRFGLFNSLTEQMYQEDQVTGYRWGLIDDPTDRYKGSSKSKALYTANTWPDEYHLEDDANKANSYRYTKNQYENNIDRHLDYGFTMPNGVYSIEVGFNNPWKCSENPTLYANYGTAKQEVLKSNIAVGNGCTVNSTVKVTDGKLTLNARTKDKAINMTYILIKIVRLDELPTETSPVLTPTPSPFVGTSIPDGWYYLKNVNSQKYLQVKDGKAAAAQNVEIGTFAGSEAQRWYLKNYEDGSFTLQSALGDFNLDIANGANENSANIQIYHAWNGDAQRFSVKSIEDGIYCIYTKASEYTKAVDVAAFGKEDGTNVCQWTYGGKGNQQWIFEHADTTSPSPSPSIAPSAAPSSEPTAEPSKTPAPTETSTPATVSCEYQVVSDWGGTFQAEIIVTNNSKETLNGWTLTCQYENQIANLWGAELTGQTGDKVTVKNPSWDAALKPGASVTISFIASGDSKAVPANYHVS